MFGRDPYRPALTHQPRGDYEMSHEQAIDVMDELYLRRNEASAAGRLLASAWGHGLASIRDMAHAGGPDSRIHLTVNNRLDGRAYHVPVCWDNNTWVLDDPEGVT